MTRNFRTILIELENWQRSPSLFEVCYFTPYFELQESYRTLYFAKSLEPANFALNFRLFTTPSQDTSICATDQAQKLQD